MSRLDRINLPPEALVCRDEEHLARETGMTLELAAQALENLVRQGHASRVTCGADTFYIAMRMQPTS